MSRSRLFLISCFVTTGVLLIFSYVSRPKPRSRLPKLVPVAYNVFITSQLGTEDVPALRRRMRIKTIVDIRPDGEAANQTPSSEIEGATKGIGMGFYYIPVPHEGLPASAVDALGQALADGAKPAVLYCRTGRRAVRLFALEEASRVDGPNSDAIFEMVRFAGFTADDLKDEIQQRIAHRSSTPAPNP